MTADDFLGMGDAGALRALDPAVVTDEAEAGGERTLVIARSRIRWAAQFLKQHRGYSFLADIAAVDRHPGEPRFELAYHLLCAQRKERLRLKCLLPGDTPEIESVTSVWRAAHWCEREIFDLFGIRFAGHPNLRRLLLPEDWEGHPLRKDYPLAGWR